MSISEHGLPDHRLGHFQVEEAQDGDGQVAQVRIAAAVFGAAVLYALAIQLLNFEVANYVFLVAAMYLLGQRNPIVIAGVATATMLLIKLLFFVLLDVSRPQGLLF